MPLIAVLDGILIRMYFMHGEHNPPHVHALHNEFAAAIDIRQATVMDGWLPPKEAVRVSQWVARHQDELLAMWYSQEFKRLPSR